jgi:hypothetical protein
VQVLELHVHQPLMAAAVAADCVAQAIQSLSDCESLNASISRIWPVAVAKADLTAADAGLGGSSGGPSGDQVGKQYGSPGHESSVRTLRGTTAAHGIAVITKQGLTYIDIIIVQCCQLQVTH